MATVNFKAFKHHKKKSDDTINIKLVVYHKGQRVYPDTDHYVTEKQLKKSYEFKDPDLIITLTKELSEYRKKIGELGRDALNNMTAAEVGEYLLPSSKNGILIAGEIDFVKFGRMYVAELKSNKQVSMAGMVQAVINNLVDFNKTEVIYTSSINYNFLIAYEKFLRHPRKQIRNGVTFNQPAMGDAGVFGQMNILRVIFKEARRRYNDEDLGLIKIPNYPFSKYKLKSPPEPEDRDLPVEFIRKIRDCPVKAGSRAEIARDFFMGSFYLLGINAIDIYNLGVVKTERISYNRSKTKGKRTDQAFISVRVVPEVNPFLDKYSGKLKNRFSTIKSLWSAISDGMSRLAGLIRENEIRVAVDNGMTIEDAEKSIPLILFDFYGARHSVGTIAKNVLGYSIPEISEALNHEIPEYKMTKKYIRKDWSLIDRIQSDLVNLLSSV